MNRSSFIGTGVAMITPFNNDGSVDYPSIQPLVDFVISGGVDYLVVLGTTAETATLSATEKRLVMDAFIHANNGRVPLVLGIGGNNTQALVNELQDTDFFGFSAILSVSPYYNRPSQEGIYRHFCELSKASPLPIILYNIPQRTGSNMEPETVFRIANDCPNVIGIKEAKGDIHQAKELIAKRPSGFLVISGDDSLALSMVLEGGDGVISVIGGGFPSEFSELISLGLSSNSDLATQNQQKLSKIIQLIYEEGNPAGIKSVLSHRGLCTDQVRLPLVAASQSLSDRIKDCCLDFSNFVRI